jgi:porin
VSVGLDYTAEVFQVASGGLKRGAAGQGLIALTVGAEMEKLAGWPGTTAHVHVYDTRGPGISQHHAGDLGHLSNIEFADSTRLFEGWVQRTWAEAGVSLRAGQLALDGEFGGVDAAAVFCHSNFGAIGALSGVRLRAERSGGWFVQGALFDGNPAPDFLGDPTPGFVPGDRLNRHGLRVKLSASEGALLVAEAGRASGETHPLAWRVGAVYHSDTFSDQRFDDTGRALANPASTGTPRAHRGNLVAFAGFDRVVWRGGAARVNAVARLAVAPGDRNLISESWEAGIATVGLLPGRPADAVALGFAGLQWGHAARGAVRDDIAINRTRHPAPDGEHVVELTWRAEVRPGWAIQPDVQWIRHPGGSSAIPDVLAVGLRTSFSF